jgi:hypothetical protein
MFYELDEICASALEVAVEVYIDKIENTTYHRAEVIIGACLSDDDKLIEKAKRIFNLIK